MGIEKMAEDMSKNMVEQIIDLKAEMETDRNVRIERENINLTKIRDLGDRIKVEKYLGETIEYLKNLYISYGNLDELTCFSPISIARKLEVELHNIIDMWNKFDEAHKIERRLMQSGENGDGNKK